MTEQLKKKLNDSVVTRWGALAIVAFTMMAAYYVNDVMAPLKNMLESDLAWTRVWLFHGSIQLPECVFTDADLGRFDSGSLWYSFHRKVGSYLDGSRYGIGILCNYSFGWK